MDQCTLNFFFFVVLISTADGADQNALADARSVLKTLRERHIEDSGERIERTLYGGPQPHECPFGFDYLPEAGSCFAVIFEEMSWYSATARCRAIMSGAHLAAIKSQRESNAISRYLQWQFSRTGAKLSGASGWCTNGYLVWTSGQTKTGRCNSNGNPFVWKTLPGLETPFSHINWGRDEPNCSGDEGCVQIASCTNHAWNDCNCQGKSFPLCQISR